MLIVLHLACNLYNSKKIIAKNIPYLYCLTKLIFMN